MAQLVFCICIVGAAYSYFLYPMLLLMLPRRQLTGSSASISGHRVAIIIAARNEAHKISQKLENTLSLERTGLDVDIIVASDASDDGTDNVVLGYAKNGVRLVRSEPRRGKEQAQGLAIDATDADLLVFTDAGAILPANALTKLVEAFRDPSVGAVSSVDRFITADGSLQGEGAYVRYEMWLRDLESHFFSLVGLSGSFFAARKTVCTDWDVRVPSDFGTALNCIRLGMRAVSDRQVIGYYKNLADTRREYQRKLRTVTRGMNGLRLRLEVLDIFKYGRFAFQVFSHKVMRWLVPWFLVGALFTSALLALTHPMYLILFAAQVVFYCLPFAGSAIPALQKISLMRLAIFFVEVNVAILHAALLAFLGRSILSWEPSKR